MASFVCNHSAPDTIGWQINGSSLTMLQEPLSSHITFRIFYDPDGSVSSILMIEAINEFNESNINCLALFDGAQAEYSSTALLKIQGIFINNTENSTSIKQIFAFQRILGCCQNIRMEFYHDYLGASIFP